MSEDYRPRPNAESPPVSGAADRARSRNPQQPETAGLPPTGPSKGNAGFQGREGEGIYPPPIKPAPIKSFNAPSPRIRRTAYRGDTIIVGRLAKHGEAPYQFRENEDASYFVKILTNRGMRTIWGRDLDRALLEGQTKPRIGDIIGARRAARQAVTLVDHIRNPQGEIIATTQRLKHRTQWQIEKLSFFAEALKTARRAVDAQADLANTVRKNPELRSTFLSLHAAERVAAQRIQSPQDRQKFIEMVQEAMTASSQHGNPLPDIRLRDNHPGAPSPALPKLPKKDHEPTR